MCKNLVDKGNQNSHGKYPKTRQINWNHSSHKKLRAQIKPLIFKYKILHHKECNKISLPSETELGKKFLENKIT